MNNLRTFAVMAKPAGSACNLRCSYCYYNTADTVMNDIVLDAYIKRTLEAHGKHAPVEFAWHGGEPALCGVDFFRRAVSIEKQYARGRKIQNTFQTNGTLLDDEWCGFFKENNFFIGISIDGPMELHDANRRYPSGSGSFENTMRGLSLLRKWSVPYNTLTTINPVNVNFPREVYEFLRTISDYMQFLPVVEGVQKAPGIESEDFGNFLCSILDVWRSRDVGTKFIQIFEAAIGNMMEKPAGFCVHEPVCGHVGAVETDGKLYSCDWFADERHCLGNILETPILELMEGNRVFGMNKADSLTQECLNCAHLGLCWGGCPKHRHNGANKLCAGYKKIFSKIKRTVRIER